MEIQPTRSEDDAAIVALFHRYDFALKERAWYDWKHRQNPLGPSKVYKLVQDGKIVGSVAIVGQEFRYLEGRVLGLQAVDGLMGEEIRGKGLFNEVMAFVTSTRPATGNRTPFYLGFASKIGSMKALEHAGWQRLAEFHVRSFLLTPRKLFTLRGLRLLAPLITPLWGVVRTCLFAGATDAVRIEEVRQVSDDLTGFQPQDRVHGDRSPAFLDWRVFRHPRDTYRVFLFRAGGKLVGYAICKVVENTWEMVEFRTSIPGRQTMGSFLRYLHREGLCHALDVWLLSGHLQEEQLPRFGGIPRGTSGAMFVYGLARAGLPTEASTWAGSYLDSDW